MKTDHFKPEFAETFPNALKVGVFYISVEFNSCAHLCACGCGHEVITTLSPAQWAFSYNGKDVSLHPSVGNWALTCKSHYVIDSGRVRWARQFSKAEIDRNRARDRRALEGESYVTDEVEHGVARTEIKPAASAAGPIDPIRRFLRWARPATEWMPRVGGRR